MKFKEIFNKKDKLKKAKCHRAGISMRTFGISLFLLTALIIIFNNIYTASLEKYKVGELNNARICSTILPLNYSDDKLVIFGGYNNGGTSKNVELYNIADTKNSVLFKSNFDNSYGNFAKIITKKNEKVLINIQPIQFTPGAKYGIETYNFTTGELKLLDLPIKKRKPNDHVRYSFDSFYIYIMDDSAEVEMIDYFNFSFAAKDIFYKKTNTKLKNFGMKGGAAYKSESSQNNIKADSPIIFEVMRGLSKDKFNAEYIIIDGKNIYKETRWDIYSFPIKTAIKLPVKLKNAEIINIVQIDNQKLLFVFRKNNEIYFTTYKLGNKKLKILGKTTSEYTNQNYVVFDRVQGISGLETRQVILQIGGVKTTKPFSCGDKLDSYATINNAINKIHYFEF